MLKKLENYFQTAFTTTYNAQDNSKYWFITEDNCKFGIVKTALSDAERNLLLTLFHPIDNTKNGQNNSSVQQKWYDFLNNDGKELPFFQDVKTLRFCYFYLKQPIDDLHNFKEYHYRRISATGNFNDGRYTWHYRRGKASSRF